MKLKNVRPNSRISIGLMKEELTFKYLNGEGSYCTKDNGDVVNVPANAEVKVIQVY